MRAQSRQAVRHAGAIRRQSSAILDEVTNIVAEVLAHHDFALTAPVAARFEVDERESTGVAIEVRLADPSRSDAARAAIVERFGGLAPHDSIEVI